MLHNKTFDFGENWLDYSRYSLNSVKFEEAKGDFLRLLDKIQLKNKRFLDAGFGQGIASLIACEQGAKVTACDINEKCCIALEHNRLKYTRIKDNEIKVIIGSILDKNIRKQLVKDNELYDIVYSWGVLHHTGRMYDALSYLTKIVKQDGYLILAIYNKHWSSPIWKILKNIYCRSPKIVKEIFILLFLPIIYLAKLIVTRSNPLRKSRGMGFYYDVVDWIGGYPYEYASIEDVTRIMDKLGFCKIIIYPPKVPTGCTEYVFKKKKTA